MDSYLYKYRVFDPEYPLRTERIFTANEVYFPSPIEFNDPFDCKFDYNFGQGLRDAKKYWARRIKSEAPNLSRNERRGQLTKRISQMSKIPFQSQMSNRRQELIQDLGVFSLSKVPNDILMWSHYADSHKGFCLEFSHDESEPFFGRAQPIKYSDTFPIVQLYDGARNEEIYTALTTKSQHWAYEKEWRLIDAEEGFGLKEFPSKLLVGVIFGIRMSERYKQQIMAWCSARKEPPKFYQATEMPRKYALEISPL